MLHLHYFAQFMYIFCLDLGFVSSTAATEDSAHATFKCIAHNDNKGGVLSSSKKRNR